MKIGFFQFQPAFGDVRTNLDKIEEAVGSAGPIDLLVLPELCTTGYQFLSRQEVADLAEPIPDGQSVVRFAKIAESIQGTVVAGIAENDDGTFFNSAVVVQSTGVVATYRKVHLFYEEKDFFAPGDRPLPVVSIGRARIGVMICFDWMFPEAARTLALQGAQILCLPANLVLPYCQSAMKIRALENHVFTIVANRFGTEQRGDKPGLTFTGRSQITDVKGNVLESAPEKDEFLGIVKIDPKDALDKQVTPKNHIFRDRRPEFYRRLCESDE